MNDCSSDTSSEGLTDTILTEFEEWKKKLKTEASSPERMPIARRGDGYNNDIVGLGLSGISADIPRDETRVSDCPESTAAFNKAAHEFVADKTTDRAHVGFRQGATSPHNAKLYWPRNYRPSPETILEEARRLAAEAAKTLKPDPNVHPYLMRQWIGPVSQQYETITTDTPKAWRPRDPGNKRPLECCKRDSRVCSDCGFIICPTCKSSCRGPQHCIIGNCMRCVATNINICAPHLKELRESTTRRFHGYMVDSAVFEVSSRAKDATVG